MPCRMESQPPFLSILQDIKSLRRNKSIRVGTANSWNPFQTQQPLDRSVRLADNSQGQMVKTESVLDPSLYHRPEVPLQVPRSANEMQVWHMASQCLVVRIFVRRIAGETGKQRANGFVYNWSLEASSACSWLNTRSPSIRFLDYLLFCVLYPCSLALLLESICFIADDNYFKWQESHNCT